MEPVAAVSGWSIGQHLSHMMLVDRAIVATVVRMTMEGAASGAPGETARAAGRAGGINVLGRAVFAFNFMPRGRGQATALVQPLDTTPEALRELVAAHEGYLTALGGRLPAIEAARVRSQHPVFGQLTSTQWLRFIAIHHHHHLKIIRDIERQRRRRGAPPAVPGAEV
jgi:hypothetical protein